ncbi:MAG: PQQ-binding-like beta-propeller repeat protein [Thaumarchaeota archaeon]|nr:PQQ-binding-like beta-propeller repeat protein [Nitrososphaerota archaeon]
MEEAERIPGATITIGIQTTPIVASGIVYISTPSSMVIAFNAADGAKLWSFQPNLTAIAMNPIWGGLQIQSSLTYHDGLIWFQANECTIYGLDALIGSVKVWIPETCAEIPGNTGHYVGHYAPVFYKNILVTRASGGATGGRGFVAGYDIASGRLLWRWYSTPPAGGDPDWDERTGAAKGNIKAYRGDWGSTDLIGGGSVWALIAVDDDTGVIYFPTGTAGGGYDASLRPGPNLYTNAIIALNATNGEMLWYYQTTPHDINYNEAGVSIVIGEVRTGGGIRKAVMTGTKGDWVYFLDAKTGSLIFDPIKVGNKGINRFNENLGNDANFTLSQRIIAGKVFCPGSEGGIQSYSAYAYNTLYIVSQTLCRTMVEARISYKGKITAGFNVAPALGQDENSTLYAIDGATGRFKWGFSIPNRYQGSVTVSNNVVYLLDIAAILYAVDAENGNQLNRIPLHATGVSGVSLGADARGEMNIYASAGARPGVVMALAPLTLPAESNPRNSSNFSNLLVILSMVIAILAVAYAALISKRKLK